MKQDISQERKGVDFGSYDSIVIKKHITDIEGGRTLDMTGYPLESLLAAHVIISQTANSEKVYKPLPIVPVMEDVYTAVANPTGNPSTSGYYEKSGETYTLSEDTEVDGTKTYYTKSEVESKDADGNTIYQYGSLPAGAVYEGLLYRSILAKKPAASILIDGVVNDVVMKYQLGAHASGFKAACPHIIFNHDEEA